MANSKNLKAMVAGHICVDITPGFDPDTQRSFTDILAPGKLINVEQAVIGTGGVVSNTGQAMAKLGIDVKLNGKIGDDHFGIIIKSILGTDKASSFKTVTGQSSSYSIVLAIPGIDRIFLHNPGTNDTFTADDVDYDTLSQCSLLHFGYPTLMKKMFENDGAELVKIFRKAKQLGVVTSLDMSLPDPNSESGKADWNKILKQALPYVDIFLPSVEEIAFMLDRELFEKRKTQSAGSDPVFCYGPEDMQTISDKLLAMGVKIAAIKAGIKGYYLRTSDQAKLNDLKPISQNLAGWSNREIWASSYRARKFGSAAGAGDATIAGFLAAFLHGLGPETSVKAANALGWQNVSEVDTLSGIQDWDYTMQIVNDKDTNLNPMTIDQPGWTLDQNSQIYYGPNDKQQ